MYVQKNNVFFVFFLYFGFRIFHPPAVRKPVSSSSARVRVVFRDRSGFHQIARTRVSRIYSDGRQPASAWNARRNVRILV